MHTGKELKILENNSRPGDPEIINILPLIKEDFVDLCFKLLEGTLTRVDVEESASVVTYKVPPSYGNFAEAFPEHVNMNEVNQPVDLSEAYALNRKYGERIRVYPGALEIRDGLVYPLKSRAVGVLGIGESLEEARRISMEGIDAIRGGALWSRTDVASEQHIQKSIAHMEELRCKR
jgi:phosphoribosylamine--glycine ligase